jgi:hypothetical protein
LCSNNNFRQYLWTKFSFARAIWVNTLPCLILPLTSPCLSLSSRSLRSMVRAVKGMIAEKEGIFTSFIISLIAFQVMTLATTWIVMKTYASATCTAILIAGGLYWYKYCLRIYNRFKFIEPDIEWKDEDPHRNPMATDTTEEKS